MKNKIHGFLLAANRRAIAYAGVALHLLGLITSAQFVAQAQGLAHLVGRDREGAILGVVLQMLGLAMAYYGKPHTIGGP
jgi:hypothetical protein